MLYKHEFSVDYLSSLNLPLKIKMQLPCPIGILGLTERAYVHYISGRLKSAHMFIITMRAFYHRRR
jgi:hypothetical protein